MNEDNKRAILAVVLSGIIIFGWQYLFGPTTPPVDESVVTQNAAVAKSIPDLAKNDSTPIFQNQDIISLDEFVLSRNGKEYFFRSDLSLIGAKGTSSFLTFNDFSGADAPLRIYFEKNGSLENKFRLEKISSHQAKLHSLNSDLIVNLELDDFVKISVSSSNEFKTFCDEDCTDCKKCNDFLEEDFPIDNDLIDTVVEMCIPELIQLFSQNIEDLTNNSRDSLKEQSK
jgi:hypothetical protein